MGLEPPTPCRNIWLYGMDRRCIVAPRRVHSGLVGLQGRFFFCEDTFLIGDVCSLCLFFSWPRVSSESDGACDRSPLPDMQPAVKFAGLLCILFCTNWVVFLVFLRHLLHPMLQGYILSLRL